MQHAVDEVGECPHWCEACRLERQARERTATVRAPMTIADLQKLLASQATTDEGRSHPVVVEMPDGSQFTVVAAGWGTEPIRMRLFVEATDQ